MILEHSFFLLFFFHFTFPSTYFFVLYILRYNLFVFWWADSSNKATAPVEDMLRGTLGTCSWVNSIKKNISQEGYLLLNTYWTSHIYIYKGSFGFSHSLGLIHILIDHKFRFRIYVLLKEWSSECRHEYLLWHCIFLLCRPMLQLWLVCKQQDSLPLA